MSGKKYWKWAKLLLYQNSAFMQNTNKQLLIAKTPQRTQVRSVLCGMEKYKLQTTHLSLKNPLDDYQKLIKQYVQIKQPVNDEILENNFKLIADAAREAVWKLLFEQESPLSTEQAQKVAGLLEQYKRDASFYEPYAYNQWIPKIRDELLRRKMIDFWRDYIVAKELGPCWARDSDYFDNLDDVEPAKFYKYADCEAPFATVIKQAGDGKESKVPEPSASCVARSIGDSPPAKISLETPATDYSLKITHQNSVDCDNDEAFRKIYEEAQEVLWKLLFSDTELSQPNFDKAAALLEAYKQDACFILPHDYNAWIVKLRDELFARKRFDFWKKVVVEKQLGLCWYKDCDHFDDATDERPIEFYKSGDKIMQSNV